MLNLNFKLYFFFKQRFDKVRVSRIKSHQIGASGLEIIDGPNETNERESKVQDGSSSEDRSLLNNSTINVDELNSSHIKITQNYSLSDDENLSQFANSRTLVLP